MNGRFKFIVSKECGCTICEAALKEFDNTEKCLVCSKTFNLNNVITLYNEENNLNDELSDKMNSAKNPKCTIPLNQQSKTKELLEAVKSCGQIKNFNKTKAIQNIYTCKE
jgi:hypothetical protein